MLCPIIFNSNTIELTMNTSCYLGLRLTLCFMQPAVNACKKTDTLENIEATRS